MERDHPYCLIITCGEKKRKTLQRVSEAMGHKQSFDKTSLTAVMATMPVRRQGTQP